MSVSTTLTTPLPTGRQHVLELGGQRAVITAVGASIRSYSVDGRDVVLPFDETEIAPAFSGAVLAPWPNRLRDGVFGYEGHTYEVRVRAVNAAVAGAWSEPRTVTPTIAGRLFHGLPMPVRAVDTRAGGGPLAPGSVLTVPVVAATGVAPRAVAAVSMNLTATNATGPGYLTAWPCDQPPPA